MFFTGSVHGAQGIDFLPVHSWVCVISVFAKPSHENQDNYGGDNNLMKALKKNVIFFFLCKVGDFFAVTMTKQNA